MSYHFNERDLTYQYFPWRLSVRSDFSILTQIHCYIPFIFISVTKFWSCQILSWRTGRYRILLIIVFFSSYYTLLTFPSIFSPSPYNIDSISFQYRFDIFPIDSKRPWICHLKILPSFSHGREGSRVWSELDDRILLSILCLPYHVRKRHDYESNNQRDGGVQDGDIQWEEFRPRRRGRILWRCYEELWITLIIHFED